MARRQLYAPKNDSQSVRKHRPDYQIALFMGLLMLLGLIIMYAIGPQRANVLNSAYSTDYYTDQYFFIKQALSSGLALAAFIIVSFVPYKFFQKNAGKILIIGLFACALLAIAGWAGWGIAQCSLGACRWFYLGPFGSLQPAELLKFGILIFVAGFLGAKVSQGKINDLHDTMIPLGVIMAIALIFVVIIQKDLGTGISLVAIVASMLVVGGLNKKTGLILLIISLVAGIGFIVSADHRIERVVTFFQGDSAVIDDNSYHIEHAKMAIGSGGLFGVGIGNSVQATGYLPEAINDSVFAIIGETFGFVGVVTVLFLFTALFLRVLKVMDHLVDDRARLVAAGVFGWLAAHVILNIAAMIGLLPLTGITLPLLSFGGTSMILVAAAIGLVFQLSRYTVHKIPEKESQREDFGSRRRVGRSRYTANSSSR